MVVSILDLAHHLGEHFMVSVQFLEGIGKADGVFLLLLLFHVPVACRTEILKLVHELSHRHIVAGIFHGFLAVLRSYLQVLAFARFKHYAVETVVFQHDSSHSLVLQVFSVHLKYALFVEFKWGIGVSYP